MFNQPEICVISDLHFGVHQNSPIWHDTALKFIDWLVIELNNRGIKGIIICGDVFHNRNDIAVNTLNTVAEIFNKLSDFSIYILVGNHDAFYKDRPDVNSISILNGRNNILICTAPVIETIFGTKLAFIPWGTTIDNIPEADIVFGHFEITSFKMNNFKMCEHGFSPDELFKKSDLIITGHFHLKEERTYKDGTIIYLGSPYELDWSDKDSSKGIFLLDITTKKYTFIENKESPKHIEIKLSDLIKAGMAQATDKVKGNIIKFIVDKEIDTDKVDILAKKLNSFQPLSFNIEYFWASQVEQQIDTEQTDLGVDTIKIIDDFITTLDVKHKDKVLSYVTELYTKAKQ